MINNFFFFKRIRNWHLLLSFLPIFSFAQISIEFPKNRIVFQRNNNNTAFIEIAGTYNLFLDRIEARVIPVNDGQGIATNWVSIVENPSNGNFLGGVTATGGWYRLQIRGIKNNQIVTNAEVERVGVGEVFIYAGQSNAEGNSIYPGASRGATDDRVSSINYSTSEGGLDENLLPFNFEQLRNSNNIAPYNTVPWCWGRLGDRIAQQYNVPVLFYGAALGGSASSWWSRSANGEDLRNEFPIFIRVARMPFRAMEAALQYYASRTGVRAILWHQGESDSQTSAYQYFLNMNTVIQKSRDAINNQNLAWMMARTSRQPETYQNVIDGQDLTINTLPGVFRGPYTDVINSDEDRYDGIHFQNAGLDKLADSWLNSINETGLFFNSTPIAAQPLLPININCNPSSSQLFTLNAPSGYNYYEWTNGSRNNIINASSGNFSIKTKNAAGIVFFSPTINVENRREIPAISASRNTSFCEGQSIDLTSNYSDNLVWNNGETRQSIRVSQTGNFFLTRKDIFGCTYTSNSINTTKIENPKPIISALNATTFCEGGSTQLTVDKNYANYTWSTNEKTKTITTSITNTYQLNVSDSFGCSGISNSITVNVNPTPQIQIQNNQEGLFCEGSSIELNVSGKYASYNWSTNEITPTIRVNNSRTVSLTVTDEKGCKSDVATTTVEAKKKPSQPEIQQISPFSITVIGNKQTAVGFVQKNQWQLGNDILNITSDTIKTSKSGEYRLKRANFYARNKLSELVCESELSQPLTVQLTDEEIDKIIAFPNPIIDGFVNLESLNKIELVEYSIYNVLGVEVKSGRIENLTSTEKIEVKYLPQGSYFLKLRSSRKSEFFKLMIVN